MENLVIQESRRALANLDEIATYYETIQLGLGFRFAKYYYAQIERLSEMPNIGRAGKVFGTRELILQDFPYLIIYRVKGKYVQILRIFHQQIQYPTT